MGAVRGLGALLVLLSGGMWGLFQAKKLWDRERLLLDLSSLLRRCAASIRYAGRPLGEWVRQEEKASRFCWEAARRPCFAADPRTALEQAGKSLLTREEDRAVYLGFVRGLGESGVQDQLEHIQLYEALLGPCLGKAREERAGKTRLYLALGLFCGITLCLALL